MPTSRMGWNILSSIVFARPIDIQLYLPVNLQLYLPVDLQLYLPVSSLWKISSIPLTPYIARWSSSRLPESSRVRFPPRGGKQSDAASRRHDRGAQREAQSRNDGEPEEARQHGPPTLWPIHRQLQDGAGSQQRRIQHQVWTEQEQVINHPAWDRQNNPRFLISMWYLV